MGEQRFEVGILDVVAQVADIQLSAQGELLKVWATTRGLLSGS
jgi:hypothetical protein